MAGLSPNPIPHSTSKQPKHCVESSMNANRRSNSNAKCAIATGKSSKCFALLWSRTTTTTTTTTRTDNVDSNRMFKKHNPRRMMMNGPQQSPEPNRTENHPQTPLARRRLAKSLMNDVASFAALRAGSSRLDAVAAAFSYLQEKCQQNASDISNTPTTATATTPDELFEAAAKHNFHLRVILMMLSDCAENENETKT